MVKLSALLTLTNYHFYKLGIELVCIAAGISVYRKLVFFTLVLLQER